MKILVCIANYFEDCCTRLVQQLYIEVNILVNIDFYGVFHELNKTRFYNYN